ncbi:hypothetical protein KAI56_00680 [Candidatus Parcubacteria bacterium]|nr:hypothetical protein [Candidatus Parcubacteria bacterium]
MSPILTLNNYNALPPTDIIDMLISGKTPKGGGIWKMTNEIKPVDLYCYLYAKFGPPNGIQNILRENDSDNLIHWDWTLFNEGKIITFLGLNLRTEIHLIGDFNVNEYNLEQFIRYLKSDFSKYGKKISDVRKNNLENWTLFTNPYITLDNAVSKIFKELSSLKLNPKKDKIKDPGTFSEYETIKKRWKGLGEKYSFGVGLSLALKMMLPILAESFINLIIYILCKPKIKSNKRTFDAFIRSDIDVKIQSLNNNCFGFSQQINWDSDPCKKYNSIINQRNDLLHGNINIEKLKITDIYFNDRVPIFNQYDSMWEQSIGISTKSLGIDKISEEYKIIKNFIDYILSCLDDENKKNIILLLNKRDLGQNKANNRIGVLLPDHIVDFCMSHIDKK